MSLTRARDNTTHIHGGEVCRYKGDDACEYSYESKSGYACKNLWGKTMHGQYSYELKSGYACKNLWGKTMHGQLWQITWGRIYNCTMTITCFIAVRPPSSYSILRKFKFMHWVYSTLAPMPAPTPAPTLWLQPTPRYRPALRDQPTQRRHHCGTYSGQRHHPTDLRKSCRPLTATGKGECQSERASR